MNKCYLFLAIFILLGCEPDIKLHGIGEQQAERPFTIGFNIMPQDTAHEFTPQAKIINKYNLNNIIPIEAIATPKTKHAYTISVGALPAGEYRLIVTTAYRNKLFGIPLWRSHTQSWQDFIVHDNLPASCFSFDDKDTAISGWKSSHVFIDNKDTPISRETCPGLFFVTNSWPWALDTASPGGSLFVPISSECFPKASSQVTNQGRWTFSILSPALGALPAWQNIKAVQFRVATNNININIKPALQLKTRDKNFSTLDSASEPMSFDISGGRWRVIEFPVALAKDTKVNQLVLHFSGVPEQTVSNTVNSIFIDGVCPIK